ncbi:sugar ABC transporter ATP-binding protein [Verrucomicrobia bacterium]|nr:sugar ABC transporter ATP-binding protein [Verrucomicrobiota bacterium]
MNSVLLSAKDISKTFPGVKALDGVSLSLRKGEVHALMGENGAGKSTLIKILTGVYLRDGGEIRLGAEVVSPASTAEAEEVGISTVYQEVNLVPNLSIAENIQLGREPRKFGIIQWGQVKERARKALRRLDLDLDVNLPLNVCSMAIQQMVAIARALDVDAKLLILDEPTSSLDEKECDALFKILRRLKEEGMAIVFVTHFLDQVYAIADRITVLRNGCFVGEYETCDLPRLKLIEAMLGREMEKGAALERTNHGGVSSSETYLSAKGIGRKGGMHPTDLDVRKGEVLGLTGLLGSGRTETARMLFGIDPTESGSLSMNGNTIVLKSPSDAIAKGMAFSSEDRKAEGIIPNLSVRENIILAMQANRGVIKLLPMIEQEELVAHYIDALRIKTPTSETPISSLSGGNQQKVMLARWLALQPKLIILDEPTRGIDIGAKAEIGRLVRSLRERGLSVLLISSELEEISESADRVLVLRDRRLVGELTGNEINENQIMSLIAQHDE